MKYLMQKKNFNSLSLRRASLGAIALLSGAAIALPVVLVGLNPSNQRSTTDSFLISPASAQVPGAPVEQLLDVRNYGVTGNGVSDDTAAIQNAINAAIAAKATAFFPAGVYRVQVSGTTGIRLADGAKLRGSGAGSLLQAINSPTASGNMFFMPRGEKSNVTFTDMAFQSPSSIPEGITIHSVYHQGTGGLAQFRGVKMFGRGVAIKIGGIDKVRDDIVLDVENCELSGSHCILQPGTGRCHVRNTRFHDFGSGPPRANFYHAMYLYSGVSVDIQNCRFESQVPGSTGCAITLHNLLTNDAEAGQNQVPQYARILNCYFDPSIYMAVKTNPSVRTQIAGCTFQNKGYSVVLLRDADILNSNFSNATFAVSGYGGAIDSVGAMQFTSNALIQDCTFTQNKGLLVNYNNTSSQWTFQHCKFGVPAHVGFPLLADAARAVGGLKLVNCKFSDSQDYGASTSAARPDARRVGRGAPWYDLTISRALVSDGTNWRFADGSAVR